MKKNLFALLILSAVLILSRCAEPREGTFYINFRNANHDKFLSTLYVHDGSGGLHQKTKVNVFTNGLETKIRLRNAGGGYYYLITSSGRGRKLAVSRKGNRYTLDSEHPSYSGDRAKWKFTEDRIIPNTYTISCKFNESTDNFHITLLDGDIVDVTSGPDRSGSSIWSLYDVNRPITFRRNFRLAPIRNFCEFNHIGGDREFDGNGPHLRGYVEVLPAGNELHRKISINVKETKWDWTEGDIDYLDIGYTFPSSWVIENVESSPAGVRSTFDFTFGGGRRTIPFTSTQGPAQRLDFTGDTGGGDLSSDSDCRGDTKIDELSFRYLSMIITQYPNGYTEPTRKEDLPPKFTMKIWNNDERFVFGDSYGSNRHQINLNNSSLGSTKYSFSITIADASGLDGFRMVYRGPNIDITLRNATRQWSFENPGPNSRALVYKSGRRALMKTTIRGEIDFKSNDGKLDFALIDKDRRITNASIGYCSSCGQLDPISFLD